MARSAARRGCGRSRRGSDAWHGARPSWGYRAIASAHRNSPDLWRWYGANGGRQPGLVRAAAHKRPSGEEGEFAACRVEAVEEAVAPVGNIVDLQVFHGLAV